MIARSLAWQLRWLLSARTVLATALLAAGAVALAALLALHDAAEQALAVAAIWWLVLTVGGLITASRVLAAEHGEGGLRGMLLAPIDRRDLFLARGLGVALIVLAEGLATWALLIALFPGLSGLREPFLAGPLLVGAAGLGMIGALTGWASLSTRLGEVAGPVLAIPVAAPLVITGLHSTEALVAGGPWQASLTFAAGYALAVGAASYLVADRVTEVP